MRSIRSVAEIEERRKKMSLYLTIFMLLILLASTAGYAFLSNPSEKKVSGNTGGVEDSSIKVGEEYVSLINSKNKTLDIPVQTSFTIGDYSGKKVYIASDNNAVSSELASTIGRYSETIQNACYGNCTKNLPEKSCNDLLIVWNSSLENSVRQEDNCIFIDGDLKAVDAFIYRIFE